MKELIYQDRIIKNEDLRKQSFKRGQIQFCSVLETNMSGMVILEGGRFVGNSWKGCNLYKGSYTGIYMLMEEYENCNLSCMELHRTECHELKAKACGFTGSCLKDSRIQECIFQNCKFQSMHLKECDISQTIFLNCIFIGMILERIQLSETIFKSCTFREQAGGLLTGCTFENCIFNC